MNRFLMMMLVSLVPLTPATSATLDQLLPWLAPNSLSLGTSFSDFTREHPTAQDIFSNERQPGKPFNAGKVEQLPDGSIIGYGFVDDKLGSVDWASGLRVNMAERVRVVRNELIRAHGQPTVETNARVDSHGSIARIVREVYRPTIEKDYVITLMATSEGVEVALINEAFARAHGINISRETYEEAAKAISSAIPPNEKPSTLVDYLAAERAKAETPQADAKATPPTPQPPASEPSTPGPKPATSPPVETPAAAVEQRAPMWPWLVGIAALVVIIAVALRRRT